MRVTILASPSVGHQVIMNSRPFPRRPSTHHPARFPRRTTTRRPLMPPPRSAFGSCWPGSLPGGPVTGHTWRAGGTGGGGTLDVRLYRGCALVDHATRSLVPEGAVLVAGGRIGWLGPAGDAPDPGPGAEVVDAGGTTAVAGMVDAHSHLTLPGGSHWIDRAADPTDRLLAVAEDNARLLSQAGVRWARDVGAPVRDGRALSLTVRERWRGRAGYPYVRAAGCWVARTGSLPSWLPPSTSWMPAPTWSSCTWTGPTATPPPSAPPRSAGWSRPCMPAGPR